MDKLIDLLSDEANKQEINQLAKNFEEFYNSENEIEAALAKSILEYKIINIYLINRDNSEYKKKNKFVQIEKLNYYIMEHFQKILLQFL